MKIKNSVLGDMNDDNAFKVVIAVIVISLILYIAYSTYATFYFGADEPEKVTHGLITLEETEPSTYERSQKMPNDHFKRRVALLNISPQKVKPTSESVIDTEKVIEKESQGKVITNSKNKTEDGPKEILDDWTRFMDLEQKQEVRIKSVAIPMSSTFRAKLLKQVISNQVQEPVIARLYSDNPTLKNALIKGLSYIVPRNDRLFVRFTSITLENGDTYSIDATALGSDGQSGIEGLVDENIDGDVVKGVANTLLGVGSVIIDSHTNGTGSQILDDSTKKSLEKIETDIVITLEKGKRFKAFFNETLKI